MDFMFTIFPVIFTVMFVLLMSIILATLLKGISQWNKNNHSPRLVVDATVVAKRFNVSRRSNARTHTSYYVTFQVESGDRMELHVAGTEYGLLIEGDYGKLTFQGTRYIDFRRQ